MSKEYHLTEAGLAELQTELENLKARRSDIAQRLKEAKAEGDLSENADYSVAMEEQDYVEHRFAEIERIMKNAVMISAPSNKDVVELGNTVELECDDKAVTYTVVGSLESDPGAGKISEESPIGKALISKKVGDTVEIVTPNGTRSCKIMKVA